LDYEVRILTKEDMVSQLRDDLGYPKYVIEDVIEQLFYNIALALSEGEKVKFSGFGTFEPKQRAARTGRNLRNNTVVSIPSRIVPYFKAGKFLKDMVSK
jgi:nucleoid DNA-binding protein